MRAVALDLGSTAIKGGLLDDSGRLLEVRSIPAPALHGTGEIREADPRDYLVAANTLLRELVSTAPPGLPLGLTGQRSTFTLWNPRTGKARIPLISWQDRRAATWCEQHRDAEPDVLRRTGLALSAHYAGPKLAAIQERDSALSADLHAGRLLFGNLDAYLIWNWTGGASHETELSMAARTSMVDLRQATWSDDLLQRLHVPARALPRIVPSGDRNIPIHAGPVLTASLADQAASALSVFDAAESSALVNLGTGGLVLLPTRDADLRIPGYLTAPILGSPDGKHRFALEGSITGAGTALSPFGPGPTPLPESDPTPKGFAIPDAAGLGSPYWRPGFETTLSAAALDLAPAEQRRVVLEGLLFRVREIVEGLSRGRLPQRILLSGGLAGEPALAAGLAGLLQRPVEILQQQESTLLGVARLAAGLEPYACLPARTVEPDTTGHYLPAKFERWKDWFRELLLSSTSDS